jgi:hypothetical protein
VICIIARDGNSNRSCYLSLQIVREYKYRMKNIRLFIVCVITIMDTAPGLIIQRLAIVLLPLLVTGEYTL